MEKVKIKSKLLQKIERDAKLKKKKLELLKQYSGYWELPNFCQRQINEIESQMEYDNLKYKQDIKKIY